MAHHNLTSESIEMYLLRVALLQEGNRPVPVPQLAQELAISPVSANEMCKKLTEKELVTYEPYKGVTLTAEGEALARRVLRHRRLWEVFFVEKLELEPLEAEEIACRFEHVTPESLAERLDNFLGHPAFSPQNEPIPAGSMSPLTQPAQPLTTLTAGMQGQVVALEADKTTQEFLRHQGLLPGVVAEVLAVADDGLLIQLADRRLSLTQAVAESVLVTVSNSSSQISLESTYAHS